MLRGRRVAHRRGRAEDVRVELHDAERSRGRQRRAELCRVRRATLFLAGWRHCWPTPGCGGERRTASRLRAVVGTLAPHGDGPLWSGGPSVAQLGRIAELGTARWRRAARRQAVAADAIGRCEGAATVVTRSPGPGTCSLPSCRSVRAGRPRIAPGKSPGGHSRATGRRRGSPLKPGGDDGRTRGSGGGRDDDALRAFVASTRRWSRVQVALDARCRRVPGRCGGRPGGLRLGDRMLGGRVAVLRVPLRAQRPRRASRPAPRRRGGCVLATLSSPRDRRAGARGRGQLAALTLTTVVGAAATAGAVLVLVVATSRPPLPSTPADRGRTL